MGELDADEEGWLGALDAGEGAAGGGDDAGGLELGGGGGEEVDGVVLPVGLEEPDAAAGRGAVERGPAGAAELGDGGRGSGTPTVPPGFTAMPSCGGRPRAKSRAGATAKDMWSPAQARSCCSELKTGT